MAEFNNNPIEFVDFNDLFPVLNEKVGLTYEQWRKAIENSNYLKNHLGVTKVAVGKEPSVIVVDDPNDAKLDVSIREVKEGDITTAYLDFTHYVPAGNVTSVNGKKGAVVLNASDVGAVSPSDLNGKLRVFAGKFDEDGIIDASAYASEVNGLNINDAIYKNTGYEFLYTGSNPFILIVPQGTISGSPVAQEIEINNNDLIIANGEGVYPGWSIIDNSDKVVSVNGMTGAVELNFATLDDVNNAINGMWEESY